jgi:hypothetical protein
LSDESVPGTLRQLIGQHPSAIRSVCFSEDPHDPGALAHLEIETKHGSVVLIDHRTGAVYANPPVPDTADPTLTRQQRDLSDQLPGAFADRPRFAAVVPMREAGGLRGWRFELDTGAAFTLTLHEHLPIVATST